MGNGHGGARPGAGRPRRVVALANQETLTEDQSNALKASQYVRSVKIIRYPILRKLLTVTRTVA